MKTSRKEIVGRLLDPLVAPFVLLGAPFMKLVRRIGVHRMPISRSILRSVGVFPVRDHYFEPLVNADPLTSLFDTERALPGLDLNLAAQLQLLERFNFNEELLRFPLERSVDHRFYYHNNAFESGDAEFLYSMVRVFKPKVFIEIGSGHSTLMAHESIERNQMDGEGYRCRHICIEPYEQPWLERVPGLEIIRKPLEQVPADLFASLGQNDFLFVDSSHVIRPRGDVVREYLEILPTLKPGVIVHIHDIFTPRDYPKEWIVDEVRLWNEQYLLEALLTQNPGFKVLAALNYLKHHYPAELAAKCPIMAQEPYRQPGSFWIQRTVA